MKKPPTHSLRFTSQEAAGKAFEMLTRPLDQKGKRSKIDTASVVVSFDPEASVRSGKPVYVVSWSLET